MIYDCNYDFEKTFQGENLSAKATVIVEKRHDLLCAKSPCFFTKKIKNKNLSEKYKMKEFGLVKSSNEQAYLFTVENKNGMSVDFSTLGATIVSIRVKDKNGNLVDVAQGYNSAECYTDFPVGHAGGTIGPIANKLDYGTFTLNGKKYELEKNKDGGRTHCHGASDGIDIKNWNYELIDNGVKFTYLKKDGVGGHPGNIEFTTIYKLTDDNAIKIIYEAKTDKDTVINLTNHSYFNLDGEQNAQEGAILNHLVQLPASSKFTVCNEVAVPTGEIKETKGTPFDFSKETEISSVIGQDDEQLKIGAGFDQNFCVDGYDGKKLIDVAKVKSPNTGIVLTVSTNLPGFQFYTANHLGKPIQPFGKSGKRYEKRSALCVEPQFYPNAVNIEDFEKPILKVGEKFCREIDYKFSVEK